MSDKNETNHARRPVLTGVVCNALGDLFAVAMMIPYTLFTHRDDRRSRMTSHSDDETSLGWT
jgi:hypothetical protein